MKQLRKPLSHRQEAIISIVQVGTRVHNKDILQSLEKGFESVSRITVVRDLNGLVKRGLLKKHGSGRSVWYEAAVPPLMRAVDMDAYYKLEPDQRNIRKERIDFISPKKWDGIFTQDELKRLHSITSDYVRRMQSYTNAQARKEIERITIEFSWKSSRIEGNTYSLLDTERLIKSHEEAKGHTRQEALMILNHKAAFQYVWKNARQYRKISLRQIEDLHALIVKESGVFLGIRKKPVGIIGTKYMPHDNIYQIKEAIDGLCRLINASGDPFLKSLLAIAGTAYVQPFEDGNKRTSRVLGNALLLANNCCPLSYRGIDEVEYKKAIILFYEQHTLMPLKKLFMEQYEFAIKNYFL